jgi:C1A family cysteine protease
MAKHYNWKKDKIDIRDYKYKPKTVRLPSAADLSKYCSSIEDQSSLGSCTGNAVVGALEILENKISRTSFKDLSRLFVYYNERLLEGTVNEDSGAYLRDGVKALAKWGVCTENLWPYTISKFSDTPASRCYKEATSRKIKVYRRMKQTLYDMQYCISSGFPFVFGFEVYSAFENLTKKNKWTLNIPTSREDYLGGHAVCAVAFNSKTKLFTIRNSWGKRWGYNGYFYMPYNYIINKELASDFWVIEK